MLKPGPSSSAKNTMTVGTHGQDEGDPRAGALRASHRCVPASRDPAAEAGKTSMPLTRAFPIIPQLGMGLGSIHVWDLCVPLKILSMVLGSIPCAAALCAPS